MEYNWKKITKEEALEHFSNGLWYDDIGKLYGVCEKTVRRKIKDFEIVLDRKNKKKEVTKSICKVCGKEYINSKNIGYCSSNCVTLEKRLNDIELPQNTTSELGKKILELRRKGMSQKSIAKELNCATSTVSYYCSESTKDKHQEYLAKFKDKYPAETKFLKHFSNFKLRVKGAGKLDSECDWNKSFRTRTSNFRNRNRIMVENNYTYKEAIEHIGGLQTKCYLTGRKINIENDEYCLDHIIPVDKGGNNELQNMGITIPEANASKSNMTVEEYINLCKEVLENFGYKITKNE